MYVWDSHFYYFSDCFFWKLEKENNFQKTSSKTKNVLIARFALNCRFMMAMFTR